MNRVFLFLVSTDILFNLDFQSFQIEKTAFEIGVHYETSTLFGS